MVTKSINKLKEKQPSAFLSIEDPQLIDGMFGDGDQNEGDDTADDEQEEDLVESPGQDEEDITSFEF